MATGVARFAFAIFVFVGVVMTAPMAGNAQNAVDFPQETAPVAAPEKPEKPADDCLTTPSGEAPQGQRWFYRIERGTQRHCWYLRDKAEQKGLQPVPAVSTAATVKPPRPAAMPVRPNNDARAELARGRLDGDPTFTPKFQLTTGDQPAADDDVRRAPGLSRAPQPLETFSAPPPAADAVVADTSDTVTGANANLGMAAPAAMPSAGPRPDAALPKASLQRLLIAIFGALAFAGVTASLMHRFAFIWRKRNARLRRRMLWQSAQKARTRQPKAASASPPSAPAANAPVASAQTVAANQARADAPNRQDDDAQGQIEELLGRVAQRVKHEAPVPALAKLVNSQAAAAAHGQRSSARRGARA
jgi:hypothetical protein